MHGMIESGFRVEWRPLAALAEIARECQSLAAHALEPVFGGDVGAGLAWSRVSPSRLLGFFAARIARHRYGQALHVLVGWTHPFGPLGTPLIDRDAGTAVLSAWFDHVASQTDPPRLLLLPLLPTAGPMAQAFEEALARRDRKCIALDGHERALLAPAGARAHYLDRVLGGKKRKELRRQSKRLAETGTLVSSTVAAPDRMAAALGDSLALEAAGWKGRAGTAARTDDRIRGFMQNAGPAWRRPARRASIVCLRAKSRSPRW